jgi:hypothetical protein
MYLLNVEPGLGNCNYLVAKETVQIVIKLLDKLQAIVPFDFHSMLTNIAAVLNFLLMMKKRWLALKLNYDDFMEII